MGTLNRTIVGWKLGTVEELVGWDGALNRTIVGWKLVIRGVDVEADKL